MTRARSRRAASVLLLLCALVSGCSSSTTKRSSAPSSSASVDAGAVAVQNYLDAVNRLCDALLPKVIAVTNGGSLDIPLKDFFAQLPAHSKLRSDFDQQLAMVPVPPEAKAKADALNAYIRFANQLDAKRLAAAKQGQAAYTKEIQSELTYAASDPTITARNAAGFHESCDAR